MNHDPGVGEADPLAFGARTEKKCAHASCQTETDGGNIGPDVLDGVINAHTSGYRTTRGVDVEVDVFFWVFCVQQEQLSHDQVGNIRVDGGAQEDDPIP